MEESTTIADGVRGGERLATTANDSTEMPGAMARAPESSEVGAGAANVMLESRTQRPVASEERTTCPEMLWGMVGHFVLPPSPQRAPPAVEEEDKVKEIGHEES